jgi:hypothetical protein
MTMNDELKTGTELELCPFCGGGDCVVYSDDGYPELPKCLYASVGTEELESKWNTRPIEAALRSQLADKDAEIKRLTADVKALKDRADWAVNHIKQADESVATILGDDPDDDGQEEDSGSYDSLIPENS